MEPKMDAHAIMAQMQQDVRRAVLRVLLPVHALTALSGRAQDEMQSDLDRWKSEGRIFSVEYEGVEYFPGFALDPAAEYRPFPAVAEVIAILSNQEFFSHWALAMWFIAANSFLDDQCPMELLADDPEWVVEAARDTLQEMI